MERAAKRKTKFYKSKQTGAGGGNPAGTDFYGTAYRNYDPNYAAVDFDFSATREYRYTAEGIPGVYFSGDAATAEAEVLGSSSSGGTLGVTGQFNVGASNMLDLTQESTRSFFGVTTESITGSSYADTQAIGQWAYNNGYNGIIFPSAQTGGTNYVFFYPDAVAG